MVDAGLLDIMIYPSSLESMPLVSEVLAVLKAEGLTVNMVSGGGSPTAYSTHKFEGLTEIRAGTYIFNDCSYLRKEICTLEQCALKVLVTVVSAPATERVIIDGGTTTFASDMGYPMGYVVEYPQAQIYQMSEEHGFVDVTRCPHKPKVGEHITVIHNPLRLTPEQSKDLFDFLLENGQLLRELAEKDEIIARQQLTNLLKRSLNMAGELGRVSRIVPKKHQRVDKEKSFPPLLKEDDTGHSLDRGWQIPGNGPSGCNVLDRTLSLIPMNWEAYLDMTVSSKISNDKNIYKRWL